MDHKTKQNAIRKVTEMMAYLGYPTYYRKKSYREISSNLTDNFFQNIIGIKTSKMHALLRNHHVRNVRNDEVWRRTLMVSI